MTIKEVEEQTGLSRSTIRFYEKEKLIEPLRNDKNGYRDYSETDVEKIKKIAYLRTLDISVEDIYHMISGKVSLIEVLERQTVTIQEQIQRLNNAKAICEKILADKDCCFDELQIEKYIADLPAYWNNNKSVFKPDSVSFLYMWGSRIIWIIITLLCFITGMLSYDKLPPEIPVQWSNGTAISFADKNYIFVYPFICIMIRTVGKPVLYIKLLMNCPYRELVTEYLSNYLCFIALSVELFSILFIHGLLKSVVTVLFIDTAVLIGILMIGITKMNPAHRPMFQK